MLPKFLPFEGKYVSVGAVWRHNAPQEATRATVFSSRPQTMRDAVIPLLVPFEAATGPLQTRLGLSPQLNWRLPTKPRSFTTMEYSSEQHQPSRVPRHPRGTSSRVPKHPRVISFSNFTSMYYHRELKSMHQMQWQGHMECPSPYLPNPTEATNAREENERKNKKENTKNSKISIQGVPLTWRRK